MRKVILVVLMVFGALPATGQIVGWRTDGDGRYADTNPPMAWSPTKNAMSSWSNASPVLLADRSLLFVCSEPDEIVAVNPENGKIVWKRSMRDVTQDRVRTHKENGWTSPTPVSDGQRVFTVFGSGVVAAHSIDGKRLWAREVQQPVHKWGYSASPVLGGGNLIVHLIDLIALDPETGKEVWRQATKVTFGSAVVTQVEGTDIVITASGDVFNARDGSTLAEGIGKLEYATPVVQDGIVYFIEKKATAVRLPKSLDKPFEEIWVSRIQGSRHYASSVIHNGLIYAVSREEKFSILDAATGELLHERNLDLGSGSNSAYPSITLAGDKLFVSSESGTTVILEPGRTYKEIARNEIGQFRGSPVFAGKHLFVRAFDYLYCFGTSG